jgi:hypothetical protein
MLIIERRQAMVSLGLRELWEPRMARGLFRLA